MFVNRRKELKILNAYKGLIEKGHRVNIALFGLRRTGKTELLLRFKEMHKGDIIIPYLNLQKIVPDPVNISQQFSKELIYTLAKRDGKIKKPIEMEDLLLLASRLGDLEEEYVRTLIEIYKRRDINEANLLNILFEFPQSFAKKHNVKIIYILDEFQEILNVHKDILKIMRAVTEKQSCVNYWVAGSVFSIFDEMFNHKNPFFGQFKRIKLENLDRISSYELIDSFPVTLAEKQKRMIYNLIGGQPYYLTAICRSVVQEYAIQKQVDDDLIRYCIFNEIFDETGTINEHFEYILDVSLARFSNKDIYKKILFYLAEYPANLAGISSYLSKPSGEIFNYLKALLKTDMIYRSNDIYHIREPLLGFWIRRIYLGLPSERLDDKEVIGKMISDLQEKYLRASSELGKAKEFEFKAKLEDKFGIKLKNYRRNEIEFDLVGRKDNLWYIFEIKWRNKPATYRDLEKFLGKVTRSEFSRKTKRLLFISKSFTEKALKFAHKNQITVSEEDLEDIIEV